MSDASATVSTNGNGRAAGYEHALWEPETPFLNAPPAPATEQFTRAATLPAVESPFSSEYLGEDIRHTPLAEDYASLIGELHDEEFDEALEDLVNEVGAIVEDRFSGEVGDTIRDRTAMERAVRDYLHPLGRTTEEMLDQMAAGLAGKDLAPLSETEIDTLLESFTPVTHELPPAFEGFIGGFLKKAKKAVKGALKVATKVASVVAMPHLLVLNKLKGLVRPLLERVLRMAIGKLPVAVRPLAGQLAKRFLGINIGGAPKGKRVQTTAPQTSGSAGTSEAEGRADLSAADPAIVQEELDAQLAGYMLAGEAFEEEASYEAAGVAADESPDAMQTLDEARRDFAERIVQLREGENAAPVVEQFLPAILPALKLGISIIGRPRVVKFLAGLVAKFIAKYVGQQNASALSTALVDTGLRLISLEAAETDERLAGEALAATVEDTVSRLVQTAPESAWESDSLLEAYAQEAFQEAAAAHFPDHLIRDELHETANASGAWVTLPARARRKRYKKYTRVLEVQITSQMAQALRTFGGVTLGDFLRNRLGITLREPVRARVHLYEAMPGTRLSTVAFHEKGVAGLGSARRGSWSLFHPLTPETAGQLLGEPRLGRATPSAFLARRRVTAVGQRFYYLEIPGARVRMAPRRVGISARPARSSQPRVVIDFPKRQLRLALYYAEADAQEIAKLLRQRAPLPVVLKALKAGQEKQLLHAFAQNPAGVLRIVHEEAPTEELAAPLLGSILRLAGPKLSEVATAWMLEALRRELESRLDRFVGEFERAAQAEVDGVTIMIAIDAGPLLQVLRKLTKPASLLSAPAALAALAKQAMGSFQLGVRPGFAGA